MKELKDTVELMNSSDYKQRMKAEYWQTKIRYEKLNRFLTKIEAEDIAGDILKNDKTYLYADDLADKLDEPKYDSPYYLLNKQKDVMGEYLHTLEVRAVIEGVDLYEE